MAEHETTPDADLQLKKRARRRLVGATALALLAVIVLPMVMDREPRPATPDIQVRIPSQDSTGLAAKVLSGRPAATPMPAPDPRAEPAPEAKPQAKPDTKAETRPDTRTDAKAATAAAQTAAADGPAAKPAAPSAAAPASSEAGRQWVVQLGAYKEPGNVKILLAKLKGLGLPAYTEALDSPQGPRTRVRAGPFGNQEAAEKARGRIKTIGVDGTVAPK